MNNIQLFNNDKFGEIRTIIKDDDSVWFVGNDVATALGYKVPKDAILLHCKGGVDLPLPSKTGKGGKQKTKIISEPDLYRLIFNSKLKDAIKFQDWVFEEVLPQIRKTGKYENNKHKTFKESIYARLKQTGSIARLVQYYLDSGSEGMKKESSQNGLYAHFTDYVYKAYYSNFKDYKDSVKGLSKTDKNLKENLRNSENTHDLMNLATLEQIVGNVIDREIKNKTYYKDIKLVVQKELKVVTTLLGINQITNKELPQKCTKLLNS